MSDLNGITIAFDIDGTLLDPGGSAYGRTTRELLAAGDLGLGEAAAWEAYESIRLLGRAMERLGLVNANHFRAHPQALAALHLLFAEPSRLPRDGKVSAAIRPVIRESLSNLDAALSDRAEADFRKRLDAERRVRRLLRFDVGLGLFRDEVLRVAERPVITGWAARYEDIEARVPLHDPRPLLEALRARGANLIVISEGLREVQSAKLARLQLADFFADRMMTTQDAGTVPGIADLDRALEPLLAPTNDETQIARDDLLPLWRLRCIAAAWAAKSRWYFARCLQALQASPSTPAVALRSFTPPPLDSWRREPLRFVMIGDRYERDIRPLNDALGAKTCLTIRLRAGRYATDHPEADLPESRRPAQTFFDWDALADYLTTRLHPDAVPTIREPPTIADPSWVDPELIEFGRKSEDRAARCIAEFVAAMYA